MHKSWKLHWYPFITCMHIYIYILYYIYYTHIYIYIYLFIIVTKIYLPRTSKQSILLHFEELYLNPIYNRLVWIDPFQWIGWKAWIHWVGGLGCNLGWMKNNSPSRMESHGHGATKTGVFFFVCVFFVLCSSFFLSKKNFLYPSEV